MRALKAVVCHIRERGAGSAAALDREIRMSL